MTEVEGYILRVSTRRWVNRVFDMAIYFTNMRRKWKNGQTVLFLHKTRAGDAFVGYGLVEKILDVTELSELDRLDCEKGRWNRAIEFKYVKRFGKPLPIKDTVLESLKLHGRYVHGVALGKNELDSILAQAET